MGQIFTWALMSLFMIFMGMIGAALTLVAFHEKASHGLLLIAIVAGGLAGGFTFALIGGEKYGIKIPGRRDAGIEKFDPGFLGDMFVGLMTAFLGIAVAARTLKTPLFDPQSSPLIDLWFMNFSIAYISGFLGLRLVKAVSKKFLNELQLQETAELASINEANNAVLSGAEAIREQNFELAESFYRQAIHLDRSTSIRAYIGLARAQRWQGELGEAMVTLDEAIRMRNVEQFPRRVAVAYFNRACYRLLADGASEEEKSKVINDLREAVRLVPAYRHDLKTDDDLKLLRDDDRLSDLAKGS